MEKEQDYDDCYCPAGVSERNGSSMILIKCIVFGILGAALLEFIAWSLTSIFSAFWAACMATGQIVDQFGGIILMSMISVILALWAIADIYHWVTIERVPNWAKPAVWIINKIRIQIYRIDLKKRFAERPELILKTESQILADMNDGHHADDMVTAEEMAAYLYVFREIQNERRGNQSPAGRVGI